MKKTFIVESLDYRGVKRLVALKETSLRLGEEITIKGSKYIVTEVKEEDTENDEG